MSTTRNARPAWKSPVNRFPLLEILALIATAGCESDPASRTWSEDVLLDDGSTVVVERHVEYEATNSFARDAPNLSTFQSTLALRGSGGAGNVWVGLLDPILLYRDPVTREWVLVAATLDCAAWRSSGRPLPPYWEYRLRASRWVAQPLSAESIGRESNLFVLYEQPLSLNHLTVQQKIQINRNGGVSRTLSGVAAKAESFECP
jgi:hypothetical protein